MTKSWMRAAIGTAVVAGLAVAGALVFTTRPAFANMMTGRMGTMMSGDHMAMMNGSYAAMMTGGSMNGHMGQMHGNGGMMGADMGAMHATMTTMHDKVHAEIAAVLSISVDDLEKALADGKEISALAAEKSVDPAKVAEAMTAAHKAVLDELVTEGTLTEAQKDQMLQHMDADSILDHMGSMNHDGAHCDQAPVTNS